MKTSLEIPDPLWERAKVRAMKERKTLAEVVADALRSYLSGSKPEKRPKEDGGNEG